jgi:hypothetical protein
MVSQLLVEKVMETPSIEACHEDPPKTEKKLEMECWADLVVYIPQHFLSIQVGKLMRHRHNMCRTSLEIA